MWRAAETELNQREPGRLAWSVEVIFETSEQPFIATGHVVDNRGQLSTSVTP